MKKLFQNTAKILGALAFAVALYLITVIVAGTVTDYRPQPVTPIEIAGGKPSEVIHDSTFTFLSWNIGFCGLGAEMDFFYDGGKMVRPGKDRVKKYTAGILEFLKSNDTIDFILLQEVDRNSSRTGKQDETVLINKELPGYVSSFGLNYKVWFVPVPLLNPLGKVEMGQMILSGFQPRTAERFSYSSKYAWPKRLFMLDRCFIVNRFPLQNGKQLCVINTHNSAYDAGGKLRNTEMLQIRDFMLNEFQNGNYVVAGGDWNQNPPGYDSSMLRKNFKAVALETIDKSLFPPEWQFVFDAKNPTNREIDAPLTPGKTAATIIDFYILSPNIDALGIGVSPMDFSYSDHEPVILKIKLR